MGRPVLSKKAKAANRAETRRLKLALGQHLMPGRNLCSAAVCVLMKNRTIQSHVAPVAAKLLKPAYRTLQAHVAHYAAVRAALATLIETVRVNRAAAASLAQLRVECAMLTAPINAQAPGQYMDTPTVHERTTVLRRESMPSEAAFVAFADGALRGLAEVSAKIETWQLADATAFILK